MELLWKLIAKVVSQPKVVDWLIARASKTPYFDIVGPDGTVYMHRLWLFNPYPSWMEKDAAKKAGLPEPKNWFPISIRLHKIMRADFDRDKHDHPWNARTIILRGGYAEVRLGYEFPGGEFVRQVDVSYLRIAGDTAKLRFGEYHQIIEVPDEGVWTMFITGKYRGTWGFNVEGKKVQWREYLGVPE